ncbi:golvesin C-terminal-like domain-containing protein [Xylanibacter oryzae]|uniref:golvesin C-terminal-like domain-containing protein n=1 Tax=Xylanibacter oryzae TaxID=185293 RepID=UPI00068798CA|nr:fibronectin type III domain-containing protein [Xylanibacter oryzae]
MNRFCRTILILLSTAITSVSAQDNVMLNSQWGNIDYSGEPWTKNESVPYKIKKGLQNRHISVWASHGRYYNLSQDRWVWQRPNLFCTTEDLFTQTIVVPYLIPMLENAGAIVFTPRERDWQKNEIIVDNDDTNKANEYTEFVSKRHWSTSTIKGFAKHNGAYSDNENPFTAGTARMAETAKSKSKCSEISYQPVFPVEGKYAVYVSYQTMPKSIDDAHYTVFHKGQATSILVNQQMGGSTWVYIGTFDFDKGYNQFNRVVITNQSQSHGVVTADAVRFGGGMGNIERGGQISGLPRCLEGARYYAQWAGMPYSVYSSKNGADDYADDINVRSLMTNYLGGGSVYMPSLDGDKVPFELSLAIHSDAGYANDCKSLVGSLAICTTEYNDERLNSGISRMISKDFASLLLNNVKTDITYKYKNWSERDLYDKNYSETRLPEIPSAILETMSHQNFPDMIMGQDPSFKFTMARSIYKTITKFVAAQHDKKFVITPLAPDDFRIEFKNKDKIRISWNDVTDLQEPTSIPTGYVLYTSAGTSGFDNGKYIKKNNYIEMHLKPGVMYNFKVTAVNQGGESFPTEVLSAYYNPLANKTIMIINGFHRLAAPAIRNNDKEQGFDLDADPGVSYGPTAGWNGRQQSFDIKKIGSILPDGLGYCGDELAGTFVAGNDFNYVRTHADAIASTSNYNIVSCSSLAVESGLVQIKKYDMIDLLLGLEKDDKHSLEFYKTFKASMQNKLKEYAMQGGKMFISGSYIGSDMQTESEKSFMANLFKISCDSTEQYNKNDTIKGLSNTFTVYRTINEKHYAATSPDIINPLSPAFCAMQYSDNQSAAVAYGGTDYRCFTMALPFECIKNAETRKTLMGGIIKFLIK